MKYIIYLIVFAIFLACSPQEINSIITFPKTISNLGITELGKVRLYANGSEIKTSSVVDKFAKKYTKLQVEDLDYLKGKIKFLGDDSLNFLGDFKNYHFTKTQDLFVITTPYVLRMKNSDFRNEIIKYPFTKKIITGTNNVDFETKQFLVGKGDFRKLEFKIVTYKLKITDKNGSKIMFGLLLNEFNQDAALKINKTDTLMVQEFVAKFGEI